MEVPEVDGVERLGPVARVDAAPLGAPALAAPCPAGQDGSMARYTGMEHASSRDPHDWGRAMAVALNRLLDAARQDRNYVGHEHLLGEDLTMRIEAEGDGATVHLTWAPAEADESTAGAADGGAADAEAHIAVEEAIEGSGRGG